MLVIFFNVFLGFFFVSVCDIVEDVLLVHGLVHENFEYVPTVCAKECNRF